MKKADSPEKPEASWRAAVAPYQNPDSKRAWGQVADSFLPYFAIWVAMIFAIKVSVWLVVPLAVVAAGFLIRIFIIFHDCGHGSFMRSKKVSSVLGYVGGVLTFTPYGYWNHCHAMHHATAGNLDHRGIGDVWTMTVREYREASALKRFGFRLFRNPFVMFVLGPVYMFLIRHRFTDFGTDRRWTLNVMYTNIGLIAWGTGMSLLIGFTTFIIIQLLTILLAGMFGIWLFYVQHQFEDVYWSQDGEWDYVRMALKGSSYYRLPKVLQWFSGNIGFHHVHHLSPRIPNYFLERCHRENPIFQETRAIGLWESFSCARLRLWDEERQKLVPVGAALL